MCHFQCEVYMYIDKDLYSISSFTYIFFGESVTTVVFSTIKFDRQTFFIVYCISLDSMRVLESYVNL